MKTLCLIDSVSRASGGVFEAERRLQQALHTQEGIAVKVIGLRDAYTDQDASSWAPLRPEIIAGCGPKSFGFAPGLMQALREEDADLLYSVGLWKYPSLAALRWSNLTRKPVMVAPHGMLDPWALRNSGAKKRVAAWLFQNALLKSAACLRALCLAEAQAMRDYGLSNPIAIIPNGVDLPEKVSGRDSEPPHGEFSQGRFLLLYLGRLHPKKGLMNLLAAWNQARKTGGKDWVLAIAGWDQGGHENELKQKASDLGIPWSDNVGVSSEKASLIFLGPKYGQAKAELYAQCDAFVLPSLSEGLPMTVLEAWAHAKPVLMTDACNLPEGFSAQAALRVPSSPDPFAGVLRELFEMSDEARQVMGENGLALVKDRFTWIRMAREMSAVYAYLLRTGPKPECLREP